MWARPDLRAELKGLGLLRSPDLDQAFLHVRQESFLPESLSLLAYADMPLPVHVSTNPPTMPSPRCLVAALDLLEPESGLRVLIAGCRGGYPAALLAEIVGPEHVVVVETDSERRIRSAGASRPRASARSASSRRSPMRRSIGSSCSTRRRQSSSFASSRIPDP